MESTDVIIIKKYAQPANFAVFCRSITLSEVIEFIVFMSLFVKRLFIWILVKYIELHLMFSFLHAWYVTHYQYLIRITDGCILFFGLSGHKK
jgi:hypothetical protein